MKIITKNACRYIVCDTCGGNFTARPTDPSSQTARNLRRAGFWVSYEKDKSVTCPACAAKIKAERAARYSRNGWRAAYESKFEKE